MRIPFTAGPRRNWSRQDAFRNTGRVCCQLRRGCTLLQPCKVNTATQATFTHAHSRCSMLTAACMDVQAVPAPLHCAHTRCQASDSDSESRTLQEARSTWCNPTSAIMRQIRDNVWVADRPFIWNKIDVGGRMTFIKLQVGNLVLCSLCPTQHAEAEHAHSIDAR